MIGAISSNELLAAAFGPGVLLRGRRGVSSRVDPAKIAPAGGSRSLGSGDGDVLELSDAARSRGGVEQGGGQGATPANSAGAAPDPSGSTRVSGDVARRSKGTVEKPLAPKEEKQVKNLKARDREVHRHEQAHKAAAGGLASGGPKFKYKTGPDGRRYAVGGEVNIDASPVAGDPKATIQKMEQVQRAALAPSEPSSQDRAVAAQASAAERQARAELAKDRKNSPQAGESGSQDRSASSGPNPSNGATATSPYQSITSAASVIDVTV